MGKGVIKDIKSMSLWTVCKRPKMGPWSQNDLWDNYIKERKDPVFIASLTLWDNYKERKENKVLIIPKNDQNDDWVLLDVTCL